MTRVKTNRKAKRKQSRTRSPGQGVRFFLPRARVLLALAVVGVLGWGMHSLWQQVAPSVIHRERYLLSAERITISQLPEWITADVRAEVVRDAGLAGRLSVLEDNFVQVIEDAFALHPWVEEVVRITKRYPPGVDVQLKYREPIAVVELSGPNGAILVPIDAHAVHLPPQDVPKLRKRYLPRIGGIVGRPPVGQQWPDPRVVGAARIADQLSESWESLHLVDVLPSARPEIRDQHRFFVYDLITRGGTRVVWGAAPNAEPPGEDAFDAKLSRLKSCIEEHGPLDSVRGPAIVDVRHQLEVTPRTVKKTSPPQADAPLVK